MSPTGDGLASQNVQVGVAGGGLSANSITDGKGYFAGKVPKDQPLILTYLFCNETWEFGPLSEDTNLADFITSDDFEEINISGKVLNCTGEATSNGVVLIDVGATSYTTTTDDNGAFDFSFQSCTEKETLIRGIDYDNLSESNTILIEDFSQNFDLVACEELVEYAIETIDGVSQMATNTINAWVLPSPYGLNNVEGLSIQIEYGEDFYNGHLVLGIADYESFQGGTVDGILTVPNNSDKPLKLYYVDPETSFCVEQGNFYDPYDFLPICWDANGSGMCDVPEDLDGNGLCDQDDCTCTSVRLTITEFSWDPDLSIPGSSNTGNVISGSVTLESLSTEGTMVISFSGELSF